VRDSFLDWRGRRLFLKAAVGLAPPCELALRDADAERRCFCVEARHPSTCYSGIFDSALTSA
jgi:hypothetical protein